MSLQLHIFVWSIDYGRVTYVKICSPDNVLHGNNLALHSVLVCIRLLLLLNFTKIKLSPSKAGATWDYFHKPAKFNDAYADVTFKVKWCWTEVS
jgi:hypothetical protein